MIGAEESDSSEEVFAQYDHFSVEMIQNWENYLGKLDRDKVLPGSIVCVRVRNLMIRGPATIHLSPRLNFITGRNGTGKSRIVVAVQLALGSRSSATGRGKNLNDFICNNAAVQGAYIEVTLYNEGTNAFFPNKYGKYFTVCRTLKRNPGKATTSTFSIKYIDPNDGQVKTVKGMSQAKLKDLRDKFLKQVHVKPKNPMVVLTQAESKKLLDSNKPKALYQIFLQATNLDKIGSQYNAMDKEMKHCKEQMAILANDIESHSTTIDELEVRLKSREEFSNIQEKIYICDATRGIKTYQDKDEHVQMLLKQHEKKKKKVLRYQNKISEHQKLAAKFDEPLQEKTQFLSELRIKADEAERKYSDERQAQRGKKNVKYRILKKRLEQTMLELSANEGELAHKMKEIRKIKNKMRRESTTRSIEEIQAEQQKNKIKTETQISKMQEQENIEEKCEEEANECSKQIEALRVDVNHYKKIIQDCERQLNQSDGSNDPFHKIKQDIARKSFDTPPVGPLYETISMNTELEQENFGQALIVDVVESLFKFDMNTFLVNTQQDVNSMRQILSKNRRNDVRVIKVPFYEKDKRTRKRRFPLSKTAGPDISDLSVAKSIKIDNDQVYNHLIDKYHLSKVFLCDSRQRAREVINNYNVSSCLDTEYWSHSLIKRRMQSQKRIPVEPAKYLKKNKNIMEIVQSKIDSAKKESRELQLKIRNKRGVKSALDKKFRFAKSQTRKLRDEYNQLTKHEEFLRKEQKRAEAAAASAGQDELTDFRDEATDLESSIANLRKIAKNIEDEKQNMNDEHAAIMAKFKVPVDELEAELAEVQAEINTLQSEKDKFSSSDEMHTWKSRLQKEKITISDLEDEIATKKAENQGALDILRKDSVILRLKLDILSPIKETEAALSEKLAMLVDKLHEEQQRKGIHDSLTEEDILAELEDVRNRVSRAKEARVVAKKRRKDLKDKAYCMKQNKEQLHTFLSMKINTLFDNFLLDGNSSGVFLFNKADETLDIKITAKIGNNVRDIQAIEKSSTTRLCELSGGEKTKTMLAFLLAIIRNAPSPFFIMDEPDVFLDESNRALIGQHFSIVIDNHDTHNYKQGVIIFPLSTHESWTGHVGKCDCRNKHCFYETYNRVELKDHQLSESAADE